jgi:threonine/homoserine/homoserine lactone efflux protein
MNLSEAIALFGVMAVLALVPGVSVLTVSARAAAFGFAHGVATTLGIVVGDIIFIAIAIFGLSVLTDTMGYLFVLVKYLGAAYLIVLGILLWRSVPKVVEIELKPEASLLSSFAASLLITLGDQKAILFYLGFFPAFADLPTFSYADAGIVILMAALAIGIAKLGYALVAVKAGRFINSRLARALNITAGSIMVAVGIFLMAKA